MTGVEGGRGTNGVPTGSVTPHSRPRKKRPWTIADLLLSMYFLASLSLSLFIMLSRVQQFPSVGCNGLNLELSCRRRGRGKQKTHDNIAGLERGRGGDQHIAWNIWLRHQTLDNATSPGFWLARLGKRDFGLNRRLISPICDFCYPIKEQGSLTKVFSVDVHKHLALLRASDGLTRQLWDGGVWQENARCICSFPEFVIWN